MRILVSLGSTALLRRNQHLSCAALHERITEVAQHLAGAVMAGNHLVVTFGDASQLGLLALQTINSPREALMPLDVLQAQATGWLAYELELAIRNALPGGALVVSMVTQTLVDLHDPAFHAAGAPVGPVFDKHTADHLSAELGWKTGQAGNGWCRLVPAPKPVDIIEVDAIRRLANTGVTVICGGGGGVPVRRDIDGKLHGIEAVVDKDAAGALLAERAEADFFLMLSDLGGLHLDFGGEEQRLIAAAGPRDLAAHLANFPEWTLRPKAQAAISFVRATGKPAAIGKPEDLAGILAGRCGTLVSPGEGLISFHDAAYEEVAP
ncbi:amino acid kinase family protein [Acidocella aromatica]|uniref:Carbamate kinase n=1 Tax=Acidocella aromatica TaxID=1303579 RepID=A0A840VEG7_9PROT|nr:carbamate kinase [Acidocella aromatica]